MDVFRALEADSTRSIRRSFIDTLRFLLPPTSKLLLLFLLWATTELALSNSHARETLEEAWRRSCGSAADSRCGGGGEGGRRGAGDPGVAHDGLRVHPLAGVPHEQPLDEVFGRVGDAGPPVLLGEHHVARADGDKEAALATGTLGVPRVPPAVWVLAASGGEREVAAEQAVGHHAK